MGAVHLMSEFDAAMLRMSRALEYVSRGFAEHDDDLVMLGFDEFDFAVEDAIVAL